MALRKATLRIVAAWEVPAAVYGAGFTPAIDAGTLEALGVRMQELADEAAGKVKKLQPSVEVEAVAVAGQPADVLLEQSAGAALIVVGRRGLVASRPCCSDRSASKSSITRPARSSS